LEKAQATLGHPIEIIAGREEARLIYLGVAHTLATTQEKRLVIDIGGGSTEFIIGQGFESLHRESLDIGCVNTSRRYFPNGEILAKSLRRAEISALLELQPLEELYLKEGWDTVIGASGTLRSVGRIINQMGWGEEITYGGLQKIRQHLLDAEHIDNINLKGLSNRRKPVFVGGFSVISGIFEGLHIEKMAVSDGALREGLIYDLLGRITHEDVRERTIQTLSTCYHVDVKQAERVEETALLFLTQIAKTWDLVNEEYAHMLSWAARLHEIGLSISHDQYHKHGEYLLNYSDLAGFTYSEQRLLATLVRAHRKKIPQVPCQQCSDDENNKIMRLCILLRLAILLHRSRSYLALPEIVLQTTDNSLLLQFPNNWLTQHPLTQTDLEQEQAYLTEIKFNLRFE